MVVTRKESSERKLKFCSVTGIHWDGEGARRRRLGAEFLGLEEVVVAGVEADCEFGEVDVGDGPRVRGERSRARLPDFCPAEDRGVGAPLSLGGIEDLALEFRVDDSGESAAIAGDPDPDLLDGEGVFTGLRMQRLTCLFKLDATPKRRPQVSQTNAIKTLSVNGKILLPDDKRDLPFSPVCTRRC